MIGDLGPILDHVPAYLLVLFRISGIFILAPLLGSLNIPTQVKVLLAFTLSLCVYPMLLTSGKPSSMFITTFVGGHVSFWAMPLLIATELLIGYAIGYAASLALIGMQAGGHIIGQQIGVGVAGLINPETQSESDPVAELFFLMALAIFAILGGHRVMLQTLVGSFDRVPLGGFADFAALMDLVVGLVTLMLEFAIRIAAPLLCLVFLETVAMGFISRTVPALNIMSIGFALRIVMGLWFLLTFMAVAAAVFTDETRTMLHAVSSFFTPTPALGS